MLYKVHFRGWAGRRQRLLFEGEFERESPDEAIVAAIWREYEDAEVFSWAYDTADRRMPLEAEFVDYSQDEDGQFEYTILLTFDKYNSQEEMVRPLSESELMERIGAPTLFNLQEVQ